MTRPLIIYGDPTPLQMEYLKEAKGRIGKDFLAKPVVAQPGVVGNIISLVDPVPFYVNGGIAYLREPYTVDRMERALRQVWGYDEAKNLVTPEMWLSRIMGVDIRETEEGE